MKFGGIGASYGRGKSNRKIIPNREKLCCPSRLLLKTEVEMKWGHEHDMAFMQLSEIVIN